MMDSPLIVVPTAPPTPKVQLADDALDLVFPVIGKRLISSTIGYQIFAALCAGDTGLHDLAWGLIVGIDCVGIRIAPTNLAIAAQFSGSELNVGGRPLRLGEGRIFRLTESRILYAPFVTIKLGDNDPRVSIAARQEIFERQLKSQGIDVAIALGAPRILDLQGQKIKGHECTAIAASPEASRMLQLRGLGGRRRMGGGVFVAGEGRAKQWNP